MKTFKYFVSILVLVLSVVGCIDEDEQVTPLSSDSFVSIPSASNEASLLETSSDGLVVPIVLGQTVTSSTSIQVQLSSTDGTTYNTDYTTTPAANGDGLVTISLNAGDTETSLTINPVLEEGFNEDKVVNVEVVSVGDGLILTEFTAFTLTIVNKPIIQVSESSISFGAIDSGSNTEATFILTGLGLLGDVTISSASSDFLVLNENESTFGESVTIALGDAEQEELPITLQFDASSGTLGTKSGTITLSSESAENVTISLSGKEATFFDFVFSGFEDVDLTGLGVEYTKSGIVELNNNPGEAPVDFIATGSELGFDSSFDPDAIGDGEGEPIGVGGVTDLFELNNEIGNIPFSYNEGIQGYHASDLDGILEIVFEEVTFPMSAQHLEFSIAIFLYSFEGNFDSGEGVELVWRTSAGDTSLIDVKDQLGTGNFTINGTSSFPLEEWGVLKAALDVSESGPTGQLVVRIFNDDNDDIYITDDISIKTAE